MAGMGSISGSTTNKNIILFADEREYSLTIHIDAIVVINESHLPPQNYRSLFLRVEKCMVQFENSRKRLHSSLTDRNVTTVNANSLPQLLLQLQACQEGSISLRVTFVPRTLNASSASAPQSALVLSQLIVVPSFCRKPLPLVEPMGGVSRQCALQIHLWFHQVQ